MSKDTSKSISVKLNADLGDFSIDVDLELPSSGVTAFFGHSGSGKTTLLRCIAGLQKATGVIKVHDDIWQDDSLQGKQSKKFVPIHKRPLAYVFQETSLFPHLSVKRNLEYGYKRIAEGNRQIHFDDVIEWLKLEKLINRFPHKLSGGERQRVAIARALLTSPRLLLMDEPLSALDQKSKNKILPYLEKLHDTFSIPIFYVTHSSNEVARLADHLVVLESGKVLASGPLTEILARLDLPIRQDEDAGVVLQATITEHDKTWHLARAEFSGGSLWVRDTGLEIGDSLRVRVLARDVSIALERQDKTSILNLLAATVTELVENSHPAVKLVKLEIGSTPILSRITARSADILELVEGKQVWVQIKSVAVLE